MTRRTAAEKLRIDRWRTALRERVGACEACGNHPRLFRPGMRQLAVLTVQEIGRGSLWRKLCQDKPYATLVLCWACNSGPFCRKAIWPPERQLALLKASRPDDYDLKAFVKLLRPNAPRWITESEVDVYAAEMRELVERIKGGM